MHSGYKQMNYGTNQSRRHFLYSMATLGFGAGTTSVTPSPEQAHNSEKTLASKNPPLADIPSVIVGDDTIAFRKHTLDLGCCETVTTVDMNGDGRLDIVSGENWYEQQPPEPGQGPSYPPRRESLRAGHAQSLWPQSGYLPDVRRTAREKSTGSRCHHRWSSSPFPKQR